MTSKYHHRSRPSPIPGCKRASRDGAVVRQNLRFRRVLFTPSPPYEGAEDLLRLLDSDIHMSISPDAAQPRPGLLAAASRNRVPDLPGRRQLRAELDRTVGVIESGPLDRSSAS